ncbi:2-amino-4-hydroxy-6-hydroxymethyldihydropteridine diphosphokinase [Tabrizicola sp.]|uniref:2-amino-4-hydroxy-6- hydroxymethyldihydropteridine diphosphokinase n=1 Tax=Tabrizicola sp. TaxID=2005166 RepID=UPI0026391335|nr:2-amino-4-hydroxy-6-hydroxymethyldihydropteridine diphosphokinase [Tabrizicola sp.]MDM7931239.1 2-amino-4-hydroxy-6-hydroxymethyldihydropteridine diphosphokinase [Tabrizicola sp.]
MQLQNNEQLLVAFGANLPFDGHDPADTLRSAVEALSEEGLPVLGLSRLYATPCFPAGVGPDYVNAAAVLANRDAVDLASVLARLHRVEARFGRERAQRWGMRTLDIDLLAMGDSLLPDAKTQDHWRNLPPEAQIGATPDQLILPHPRIQDRAFVLVPLADVAPDWVHPRIGKSVRQMLAALPQSDRDAVKPL